jgi:hypothetical protein
MPLQCIQEISTKTNQGLLPWDQWKLGMVQDDTWLHGPF